MWWSFTARHVSQQRAILKIWLLLSLLSSKIHCLCVTNLGRSLGPDGRSRILRTKVVEMCLIAIKFGGLPCHFVHEVSSLLRNYIVEQSEGLLLSIKTTSESTSLRGSRTKVAHDLILVSRNRKIYSLRILKVRADRDNYTATKYEIIFIIIFSFSGVRMSGILSQFASRWIHVRNQFKEWIWHVVK